MTMILTIYETLSFKNIAIGFAIWTAISFITFVSAVCVVQFLKRNPANHLPPLPHNSILGKHPTRVL